MKVLFMAYPKIARDGSYFTLPTDPKGETCNKPKQPSECQLHTSVTRCPSKTDKYRSDTALPLIETMARREMHEVLINQGSDIPYEMRYTEFQPIPASSSGLVTLSPNKWRNPSACCEFHLSVDCYLPLTTGHHIFIAKFQWIRHVSERMYPKRRSIIIDSGADMN